MAWRKKAYKVEQKVFGKGGIKGRYGIGKGKGGFKFAKLAQDLEMVKSRLNVEKKDIRSDVTTEDFGQTDGNSEGALVLDMTQAINQGIGETQRIGNSLKVTGMSIPIQLTGQNYCLSARRVRVTMLKVKSADNGVTGQEAFEKVWEVNPLSGVRDYNAPRAYRNSKTDGISVVRSMNVYVPAPTLDNGSSGAALFERTQKSVTMNLKLNDIWRYDTNADIYPGGLKYYLVIQTDIGNHNASLYTTTLDTPIDHINSGMTARVYQRTWFVDN
jgi:hypothetical protein